MAEEAKKGKLLPSRFQVAAHVSNDWSAVVEAGVPYEHVRDTPAFWAHIAPKLRPGDIIHVRSDDSAFYARLYVRSVERQAARVIELEHKDFSRLSEMPADASSEFKVEYAGPHHKHRIVRVSDRTVIQTGFDTKEAAIEAMANHIKKLAA